MSMIAKALNEFRQGDCSFQQFEARVEQDLALGLSSAENMLAELEEQNTQHPFSRADFTSLKTCIRDVQTRVGDATVVSEQRARAKLKTAPPKRRKPAVGDTINDRYYLKELIGSGGMSQVFRAADKRRLEARSRDPDVALKIMDVEGANHQDAYMLMQREAQKSQLLNHPNILRVYDFDRDGEIVFMTMELLNGESLSKRIALQQGGLPVDEVVNIIEKVSDALAYAHDNVVVHADFKPGNVFLLEAGKVKVIDWGIARRVETEDTPDSDRTIFDPRALGALTPAYASPEMIDNHAAHPRDDIYSLGCVAYELFSGKHPFAKLKATEARDSGHPLKILERATKHQWQAIKHALAFDPAQRTPDVRTFLAEFTPPAKRTLGRNVTIATAGIVTAVVAGWWLLPISSVSPPLCTHCPELISVPAGRQTIGDATGEPRFVAEQPAHDINISVGFDLGRSEVTVAQFRVFAEATGNDFSGCRSATSWTIDNDLSWSNPGFPQTDQHPVTCISWVDANAYVDWLSDQVGEPYRLPSEAEWEYTVRSITGLPLTANSDDSSACSQGNMADRAARGSYPELLTLNCNDGYSFTAPVAVEANTTAPVDMRGNVFEWTQDCWNPNYDGAPTNGSAWTSGECRQRVLRGGSWFTAPDQQRTTYRNHFEEDYRANTFGFRIAKSQTSG